MARVNEVVQIPLVITGFLLAALAADPDTSSDFCSDLESGREAVLHANGRRGRETKSIGEVRDHGCVGSTLLVSGRGAADVTVLAVGAARGKVAPHPLLSTKPCKASACRCVFVLCLGAFVDEGQTSEDFPSLFADLVLGLRRCLFVVAAVVEDLSGQLGSWREDGDSKRGRREGPLGGAERRCRRGDRASWRSEAASVAAAGRQWTYSSAASPAEACLTTRSTQEVSRTWPAI